MVRSSFAAKPARKGSKLRDGFYRSAILHQEGSWGEGEGTGRSYANATPEAAFSSHGCALPLDDGAGASEATIMEATEDGQSAHTPRTKSAHSHYLYMQLRSYNCSLTHRTGSRPAHPCHVPEWGHGQSKNSTRLSSHAPVPFSFHSHVCLQNQTPTPDAADCRGETVPDFVRVEVARLDTHTTPSSVMPAQGTRAAESHPVTIHPATCVTIFP